MDKSAETGAYLQGKAYLKETNLMGNERKEKEGVTIDDLFKKYNV